MIIKLINLILESRKKKINKEINLIKRLIFIDLLRR